MIVELGFSVGVHLTKGSFLPGVEVVVSGLDVVGVADSALGGAAGVSAADGGSVVGVDAAGTFVTSVEFGANRSGAGTSVDGVVGGAVVVVVGGAVVVVVLGVGVVVG